MVDDGGHLKPEFQRSKTGAWGSFIGTWDLPRRLPGTSHILVIIIIIIITEDVYNVSEMN